MLYFNYRQSSRFLVVLVALGIGSSLKAETTVDAPLINPGYLESPSTPPPGRYEDLVDEKKEKPTFELPPVAKPKPDDKLSSGIRINVTHYRFTGNTLFNDKYLEEMSAPYLGEGISIEQLHELKTRITLLYVNAGYINSGALLPDQAVEKGIVTFQIIEGQLENINIAGLNEIDDQYVRGRIARYTHAPININQVQEGLLLLQQNPLIDKVNARLLPSETRGYADLELDILEAKPYTFNVIVNNYRTPSVGSEQGIISMTHRNLSGIGNKLHLLYAKTEGLNQGLMDYTHPVGSTDSNVRVFYRNEKARVVEAPFDVLNITNKTQSSGIEYNHSLKRTLKKTFIFGGRIEHKNNASYLDGFPYSFTPGVVDGKSTVTRVDLYQRYQYRGPGLGVLAESAFLFGTDWFKATVHEDVDLPDSRYFAWRGVSRMMLRLSPRSELVGRGDLFWAKDALLSSEKYPVGGPYSVRGYRESLIGVERAAVVSLEYRHAIGFSDQPAHRFQLAIFSDAAWMSNVEQPSSVSSISSVGVGVLYNYKQKFHSVLYFAQALNREIQKTDVLSDKGITFELGMRW